MLILASKSPRRRDLLGLYTDDFKIETRPCDEPSYEGGDVSVYVMALAEKKARCVADEHPSDTVLGADTVVAFDGEVLGKPRDEAHAKEMLSSMSGARQEVFTGVCIIKGGETKTFFEKTDVYFKELSEKEIDDYIATGDSLDKAGGYGIQGGAGEFVTRVDGDYFNVIGLPMKTTAKYLDEISEW